ncbi:MAG: hypothetical protein LBL81_06110 [Tannerella sp.]|jgi:hypothetical protein|nr:hypothetical protein [Tannerella sp.]
MDTIRHTERIVQVLSGSPIPKDTEIPIEDIYEVRCDKPYCHIIWRQGGEEPEDTKAECPLLTFAFLPSQQFVLCNREELVNLACATPAAVKGKPMLQLPDGTCIHPSQRRWPLVKKAWLQYRQSIL